MQPISTLFNDSNNQIKKLPVIKQNTILGGGHRFGGGLIADPNSKHRKAMSSSVWLYLYLLIYTNRKTSIIRRKLGQIQEDTGYPVRTIQRHLKRLSKQNYITLTRAKQYLHIHIKKWKSFKHPNADEK